MFFEDSDGVFKIQGFFFELAHHAGFLGAAQTGGLRSFWGLAGR